MILMFIVFGVATVTLFLVYSHKVGSVVNAITIYTGMKIAIEFVFEPISYTLHLFDYDTWSMLVVNALSFCGYAAFVIGLLLVRQPDNPIRRFAMSNYLPVAWIFLLAAWLLYAPVLIEFRAYITEPRRIYEMTRTGYGLYTFGSALLTFCAYIIFLMSSQRRAIFFYALLIGLVALKGTKGQFIIIISLWIISKVYLQGYKYSLTRSFVYMSICVVMGLYVFALNFRGNIDNIFVAVSEYSDYNRNGSLTVGGDTFGYYKGQLTLETQWIPKIPRAVWPDKPKVFGEFRLAQQYFPRWFLLDQGSPSFGIGIFFADFGWFAFLIYPFIQCSAGFILGICLSRLIERPSAFYFVVAAYLSGNNLLTSGAGSYLIEHAVIGMTLMIILHFMGSRSLQTMPPSPRQRLAA